MLVVVRLIILVFLAGCAPFPHVGYYELDEAIETAETTEEKEYYEGRLEVFEDTAIKAEKFYENKYACEAGHMDRYGSEVVWACEEVARNLKRRPFTDLEDMVRTYRNEKYYCGCVSKSTLLNALGR